MGTTLLLAVALVSTIILVITPLLLIAGIARGRKKSRMSKAELIVLGIGVPLTLLIQTVLIAFAIVKDIGDPAIKAVAVLALLGLWGYYLNAKVLEKIKGKKKALMLLFIFLTPPLYAWYLLFLLLQEN
jgi:hypothetical protein